MKRERSDYEQPIERLDIAECLMLLSQKLATKPVSMNQHTDNNTKRFECKTCNKKFSSFQALGGHRASHKKPKPTTDHQHIKPNLINKKQMHECSMCGQAFATGQALGGHMRRHRAAISTDLSAVFPEVPTMPVLKRSNSSKRVVCLDLNLTPLENDLEYIFGKKLAPRIDLKFIT